jgi:hypothetical protein
VSGIALAIGRNGRLPDLDAVRAMANAGSHRARAGREEEAIASAAAIALRQFEAPRNGDASIATDEGGTVLAIVDARIDNREELAAELGIGSRTGCTGTTRWRCGIRWRVSWWRRAIRSGCGR